MPTGVYKRTKRNDTLKKLHKNPKFNKKRLAGLKKYWARIRKEKKVSKSRIESKVDNTILAANRTVRLIVIGRNPNTGSDEVMENSLVTSMQDALGTVINYLYSGTALTEVRLQDYE